MCGFGSLFASTVIYISLLTTVIAQEDEEEDDEDEEAGDMDEEEGTGTTVPQTKCINYHHNYDLTHIPEKELESEEDDVDEEGQEYLKMLAKKVKP